MAARRKAAERIETHEQAHTQAYEITADANNMACVSDFLGSLDRGEINLAPCAEAGDTLRMILFAWLQETAEDLESQAERVLEFLDEKRKAVA